MLAKEDLQESNFSFFSVKNIKNHNTLCWLIDTLFRRHIEIQEHAKYDLQGNRQNSFACQNVVHYEYWEP